MNKQGYSDNQQDEKSRCHVIPEVFYPAAEADKLLEMFRPMLGGAQRLVEENPGELAICEWFMGSFQLCYRKTGTPRPKI